MKSQTKILQQAAAQVATGQFESNFAARCWGCGTRSDGRGFLDFRIPTFRYDGELGHCVVTLGKTAVMAAVQANIVAPSPVGSPRAGIFEIATRVVPVDAKVDARILQQFLDSLYKNPSAPVLDVANGLCIVAGVAVWNIQMAVVVLADAGNALDCASWAATAALMQFRRDEVAVTGGNKIRRFSAHERDPVPLALLHIPLSITLLLLPPELQQQQKEQIQAAVSSNNNINNNQENNSGSGGNLILDPSNVEEQCKTVTFTVGCNSDGQAFYFHASTSASSSTSSSSASTSSFSYAEVKQCRQQAKSLFGQIVDEMKQAMNEDAKARKAKNLSRFEWAQQERERVGIRKRKEEEENNNNNNNNDEDEDEK